MPVPAPITMPRASRWEWAQAVLLGLVLAWTTLLNGGYGARIALVTTCLVGALLVVYALERVCTREGAGALHPAGWWPLPFLAYALANVLWVTPVRWLGWLDWLGWAQMIGVFWVTLNGIRSRGPRRLLFYTLIALGLVGVLLGCYQRFIEPEWKMIGAVRGPEFYARASGSFSIPNSLAGFLILLLPAVMALTIRRSAAATERVWWGWVGLVFFIGLGLTLSRGAWLALALMLTAWPLMAARGSWRRRAGWALLVLGGLLVAGAVTLNQYPDARRRFARLVEDSGEVTRPHMWRGAWQLFGDAPLFGTGAGSYNVLFEKYRVEGFRDEPMWAHNEYLNTLSDYGVAGFLLCLGAAAVIAGRSARGPRSDKAKHRDLRDPLVVAGMGVGVLAFSLQLAVDFNLRIPALALAGAVISALAVGGAWTSRVVATESARAGPERWAWGVVAGAVVLVVVGFFRPLLGAEALRREARRAIDQLPAGESLKPASGAVVQQAQRDLARATELDPANGQAWSDLAYATTLLAHFEPTRAVELGRAAEAAAERALGVTRVSYEFWIRRGCARDLQGRRIEAGRDFSEGVRLAPANAMAWFYCADHLDRTGVAGEGAGIAVEICLRLDPGNRAALALRQRLALAKKPPE